MMFLPVSTTAFATVSLLLLPSTQGFQSILPSPPAAAAISSSSLFYKTTVESDDAAVSESPASASVDVSNMLEARLKKLGVDPTRIRISETQIIQQEQLRQQQKQEQEQQNTHLKKKNSATTAALTLETRLNELSVVNPTRIQLPTLSKPASSSLSSSPAVKPKTKTSKSKSKQYSSTHLANVKEVLNVNDFRMVVASELEKVTIVRFYAPWCQSCRRTQPLFERLASTYPDDVNFVTIPQCDSTKQLLQVLGVYAVPYAHIYHPTQGLVEQLSMNKNVFKDFRQIAESYIHSQCELPKEVDCTAGEIFEAPYERQS